MFFIKNRKWILAFFLLSAIVSGYYVTQLRFDFSFEAFFPENDPDLEFFQEFNDRFEHGHHAIIVGLRREEGLFEENFLEKVKKFTQKSRKIENAGLVLSITNLKDFIYSPLASIQVPVLDLKNPVTLTKQGEKIISDPRFSDHFISKDGKTLTIQFFPKEVLDREKERKLVHDIMNLIDEMGLEDARLVGFPIVNTVVLEKNKLEFKVYIVLSAIVILLSMTLLFRRFWGVVVASFSVGLGTLLFFGLYSFLGFSLDLMGSLYPILMVIVGTSDVVHIMSKYVEELRKGKERAEAITLTLKEIGLATFLTSFTTAVGFISLCTSRLPPIYNFGLAAAVGVFVAYFTIILFSLALVSYFDHHQLMRSKSGKDPFRKYLGLSFMISKKRPYRVAFLFLLATGISLFFSSRISSNVHDDRDFPRDSRLKEDFRLMDQELNGISAVELALIAPEGKNLLNYEVFGEMEKLTSYISQMEKTGNIYSALYLIKNLNRSYNGISNEFFKMPDRKNFDKYLKISQEKFPSVLKAVISEDGRYGKLSFKIQDLGSLKIKAINAQLDSWVKENLDSSLLDVRHTGSKYIFDQNQELLVKGLMKSLGLAFLVVSVVMAIVFRSVKMLIISLVPNIIPLIITAGIIGLLDFQMDAKIGIVFTIAFGIAVDDTIHFLGKYKIERNKGHSEEKAIYLSTMETGKAICITTFILFFAFGTLTLSQFPPTYIIGLLIAVCMLFALITDVFLIPVILRKLFSKK